MNFLNFNQLLKMIFEDIVASYWKTFLIAFSFLLFSYSVGVMYFLNSNGLSVYDVGNNNFYNFFIMTFVPYAFLIVSVVGLIIYCIYTMRNLFLDTLKIIEPDLYQVIKSAGFRKIRGSARILKNQIFIFEILKNSVFSIIQFLIFIPFVLGYIALKPFVGILLVVSLILIYLSYILKFHISVINCIFFPVFFLGTHGYLTLHSSSDTFTMICVYIVSFILTYIFSSSQILNAFDRDVDNYYGFNVMVILTFISPIWKMVVTIVFISLNICYIDNIEVSEIGANQIIFRGYLVLETPDKIICRESEKIGSLRVFNKNIYSVMSRGVSM